MSTTSTSTALNISGTTSYLTGASSGLDTASLISAAVAQKTARADTLYAKVTANTTKIAAYQQLQSLISGLSTSMSKLASANNSLEPASNAFSERAVSLTASDSSAASAYLAVSAGSEAALASYDIAVIQLAAAENADRRSGGEGGHRAISTFRSC